jgi:uncharacterized protein YjbI with pentapeptide repeats
MGLLALGVTVAVGLLAAWVLVVPRRLAPPVSQEVLDHLSDDRARVEVADARVKLQNDLRATALQAIAGLAVLAGAILAFQQLTEDRNQADATRQLTVQGQASERFTRAIDQLGSDRREVQLGGIYGLEQIAQQAPDNRLAVTEVVIAYLQRRAPRPAKPPSRASTSDERPIPPTDFPGSELRLRAPDIQAALTVLGRRQTAPTDPPLDLRALDLPGADLRGADLRHADLSGTNLSRGNLEEADLSDANLLDGSLRDAALDGAKLNGAFLLGANLSQAAFNGADLSDTHLDKADLRGAFLQGAKLGEAILRDANLTGASLLEANLTSAYLDNANLGGADLSGTHLIHANFNGADLREAKLTRADLSAAVLRGADLSNADCKGASLNEADLQEANLTGAMLNGADLSRADLTGTNLSGADLRFATLDGIHLGDASADQSTKWPDGFDWQSAGIRPSRSPP